MNVNTNITNKIYECGRNVTTVNTKIDIGTHVKMQTGTIKREREYDLPLTALVILHSASQQKHQCMNQ